MCATGGHSVTEEMPILSVKPITTSNLNALYHVYNNVTSVYSVQCFQFFGVCFFIAFYVALFPLWFEKISE